MKSAIILLFVLVSLVSVIGINEADALPVRGEIDSIVSETEVEITFDFPESENCAISINIFPIDYPPLFRGHFSYYPSIATFDSGDIVYNTAGRTWYPYETIDCNLPVVIPISQFNGQREIAFTIYGVGWNGTYNYHQQTNHGFERALYVVPLEIPSFPFKITESNGNSNADTIPPTLGLNKQLDREVDNGFTYNGYTVDVDRKYTEFPLIETSVGKTNTIDLSIYENHGTDEISFIHIGLSLENKNTPISDAESTLGYHFRSSNSVLEPFEIVDEQNLIHNANMTGISSVPCNETDNRNYDDCMKISFQYEYRESPIHNVIAVQVADIHGNRITHYFNDGIAVSGESLNPPKSKFVSGVSYTQIDKIENTWINEEGIEFEETKGGWMQRITPWKILND